MDRPVVALQMRLDGHTYAAIGAALGVTRQRIQQLLSPPRSTREQVVRRAQECCEGCGLRVGASGHVHHQGARGLEPDDYNDADNLELLCLSCHRQAHKKAVTPKAAKPYAPYPPLPSQALTNAINASDVRGVRQATGYPQSHLAFLLGVDANTIARWERGERTPPPYLRYALARVLK